MRSWIVAAFVLTLSGPVRADIDPIGLYGETITFDVARNGTIVGRHETRFSSRGSDLVVESRMRLEVLVLVFPVYAFDYSSTEIWREGRLTDLSVRVMDDGEETIVRAAQDGDLLRIDGRGATTAVAGPILASNHWNAAIIDHDRVLNTLTGNVNRIGLENKGTERLPVPGGTLWATRYDYSGELTDTSVWYDDRGRWVKLRFMARDGSTIEYLCRTCEAPS